MTTTASPRRRRRRGPSPWHLVLVPTALLMGAPLIWMLITSLSTLAETRHFPPELPDSLQFHNYLQAWTDSPFARWLLNSTIVSVTCVLSNLVLCTLAGYAFARLRFPGSKVAFVGILATLMVPFQVIMIPTLLIVKSLHLVDTLPALMVPNLVTPFGIYLLRQFFLSLPRELEEAAWIDGCSRLRVLFRIVLPLSRPALSTVAVLTFLSTWNDLTWPLIAINHDSHYTLQLGLTTFQGLHHTQWSAVMAGNLITVLPVLLAFLGAQRAFIQSITASGLKG